MYISGATVWYNVSSVENTLAFYTEKMGFMRQFHDSESGMAIVYTNTTDFWIGFSEASTVEPSTSATVFEVENIEEAKRNLEQKGVVFTEEIYTVPGMAKLVTFADPDGHHLMLSETLTAL